MIEVWRSRAGDIEALTLDAFDSLRHRDDVAVASVPEFVPPDAQLDCSVSGGYRETPPTLIVTRSMSTRRQHFTLLHELGHHLQRTDLALGEVVLAQRDSEQFEEAACDAFAARILLPDDMVATVIGADGPTVQDAVGLFELSNASRAAISVRLAGLLKPAAVVAVLDELGAVTFAASRGGMYPPKRLSDQRENPLVRVALERRDDNSVVNRNDARVRYSNGGASIELYGQAGWAGDRMIAIMVEEAAPWLSYSPPRDGTAIFGRTQAVEHPEHPEPKKQTCGNCFLEKHPSQFEDGSAICKDCAA
jgi:hypothetical protein